MREEKHVGGPVIGRDCNARNWQLSLHVPASRSFLGGLAHFIFSSSALAGFEAVCQFVVTNTPSLVLARLVRLIIYIPLTAFGETLSPFGTGGFSFCFCL
jgi:hypothetical protein